MRMMRMFGHAALGLFVAAVISVAPLRAADTVTIGTVGSPSANLWPVFIGIDKGFFTAQNLKADVVYIQSSASVIQQLSAGSLDMSMSTGLVDPIRAIDQGAAIAHHAFRSAGATVRLAGEVEHQEPQGSQGQGDLGRRPEGHHPYLCRAHVGAARAEDRRL